MGGQAAAPEQQVGLQIERSQLAGQAGVTAARGAGVRCHPKEGNVINHAQSLEEGGLRGLQGGGGGCGGVAGMTKAR